MNRLIQFSVDYPRRAIGFAALLTIAFLPGLSRLFVDASTDSLLIPGDPAVRYLENVSANFTDEPGHAILIESETGVFSAPILAAIRELTDDLESIGGITNVYSLANVTAFRKTDTATGVEPLFDDAVLDSPAQIEKARARALGSPLIRDNFLNPEATATLVQLAIERNPGERLYEQRLVREIESFLDQKRRALGPDVTLQQWGAPFIKAEVFRYILRDLYHLRTAGAFRHCRHPFLFLPVSSRFPASRGHWSAQLARRARIHGIPGHFPQPAHCDHSRPSGRGRLYRGYPSDFRLRSRHRSQTAPAGSPPTDGNLLRPALFSSPLSPPLSGS